VLSRSDCHTTHHTTAQHDRSTFNLDLYLYYDNMFTWSLITKVLSGFELSTWS
jgi:hypothetical protein